MICSLQGTREFNITPRQHLTLIWGRGGWYPPPPPSSRFFLNSSETVKAVTLAFCIIQYHFIRDVRAKFGIACLQQSPDTEPNSDGVISDFWVSGQSLIKRNCHNSTTSDDINMKPGPVAILVKRNKTTLTSCQKIMKSLPFFQFTVNLEQSGSRIPEAYL